MGAGCHEEGPNAGNATRRFVVLDFSQISRGYLVEHSGSLRRRFSARKIKLTDICWVYLEKAPDRGWVDLEGLYLYTIKVYLRDGRIVSENLDSRDTNVDDRYRTLKRVIPWAVFGYRREYAATWRHARLRFISGVDKRRVGPTKGEDQEPEGTFGSTNVGGEAPKRTASQGFNESQGEIKQPSEKDYYQVLGVPRTVTVGELHVRFRELALMYHPDRNKSRDAEERFKAVSEAYVILLKSARESESQRMNR